MRNETISSSLAAQFGLDGTFDGTVLEPKWNGHEDKVEEEHGDAQGFVHLPAEASDAQHHEAQHPKEDEDRAGHSRTAHHHRGPDDHAVQQPRKR